MSASFPETTPALSAGTDDVRAPPTPARLLVDAAVVSGAVATLSRLVGRGLRLTLPDPAMQWLVLPAAAGCAPGAMAGDCLLLDTAAGPLYLQDGARFIAGLTGIDGSGCDDDWPPWMVGAVAGRLADTPLAGARAIRRCAAPQHSLLHLPWQVRDRSHTIAALAAATPVTWGVLLTGACTVALRMPWSDWLPLTLGWPLLLAAHRLPLALYDTLASGDLILPERAYFDSAGKGRVTLGRQRWHVSFAAPCHLQLLIEENPLHTDLTDEAALENAAHDFDDAAPAVSGASGASDDAVLGAVSVTLRFELGSTRLTLDQLRALGPHSVLEMQGGSPHAIAILCGATAVGLGEVVDVDGRLGVRIINWGPAC